MSGSKTSKVYLHIKGDREYTTVLHNVGRSVTVGELCDQFASAADLGQICRDKGSSLRASSSKGRVFDRSHLVHKVLNGDVDIFLRLEPHPRGPESSSKNTEALESRVSSITAATSSGQVADQTGSKDRSALSRGKHHDQCRPISPLIAPLLKQASEKEASQHLRAAAFIYKQARFAINDFALDIG